MASIAALTAVLALPISYAAWSFHCLKQNVRLARSTGLPTVKVYINPMNPFRLMFANAIIALLQYLPFDTTWLTRFHANGWEALERYKAHQEIGEAFFLASPGGIYLYVCNPDSVRDILQRKHDFQRDIKRMSILNVYGKNISTTEGAEWQVHRKATAAAFTESCNEIAWKEALKQAAGMMKYWTSGSQPVRSISKDTRTFTLNVLASALFSQSYPFEGTSGDISRASKDSQDISSLYRESLSTILQNIFPLFVFGKEKLKTSWWLPKSWRVAGEAAESFQMYVSGLIQEARATTTSGLRKQNLIFNLVAACETEKKAQENGTSEQVHRRTLTEGEIISNLFVYGFAGNDTTAITLAHAVMNMAGHPGIQDWIAEELQHYAKSSDPSEWDYSIFPKLKRCLAIMLESLRLCHPLTQLIKTTGPQSQSLKVGEHSYTIPAYTNINLNLAAIHTLPRLWGKDPLYWNPKRWIQIASDIENPSIEDESLIADTTNEFLPWAYGQKVCPGKKFSQVELVAALATFFRDHTLSAFPEGNESQQDATKRAERKAIEVDKRLLNEMKNSASVGLVWTKRSL